MADTIERAGSGQRREPASGEVVATIRHPVARRVADVLASRSAKPRLFVIDDTENIEQAMRCGVRLDSLYLTESAEALPQGSTLHRLGAAVSCHVLSDGVAKSLFGSEKRSRVFALAHRPAPKTLRDLFARRGDVVVLDGVRLVGNIGAITRTACALGAAGLVLLDSGLTTILDRRLVRASRGLVFALPVVLASRHELIACARRERITLATLTARAPEPLSAIRAVPGRLAIVLGGERQGVSDDFEALASYRYAIRMAGDVESLNVSVAAAIALYEHQRL